LFLVLALLTGINYLRSQFLAMIFTAHLSRCRSWIGDTPRNGSGLGHLCGTVAPGSSNDFKTAFIQRPNKQRKKHSLNSDAFGKLLKRGILEDGAGVGGGLGQEYEGKVSVVENFSAVNWPGSKAIFPP
jgi:hypothetical protein